ncbi:MAG TPA: D-alanyl-D-alanine carboxypeptidase, partial [Longimicrobiaceae bacterium]|nr:D-alanyl-D-alanine carboxypeptidase [Longimicrobiaceae bacterium]
MDPGRAPAQALSALRRPALLALAAAVLSGLAPAPLPAQAAALARDLDALTAPLRAAGARYGVLVVSLDRGDTLFSLDADAPLAPASNLKLFSTAAALRYLGEEFRWSTYLIAAGEVRDGVLEGDLVLYGTGDPTLAGAHLPGTTGALDALADSLRARGVREVRGAVVGDGSFFDARLQGYGWTAEDLGRRYGAPVSALNAGENLVRPGGRPVADPARSAAE